MVKYITISTTNDGVLHIPASSGLIVERTSATAAKIHFGSTLTHHVAITGTGLTQAFVDAVNSALVVAAETKWTESVVPVELPSGEVVTDYAVTVFS